MARACGLLPGSGGVCMIERWVNSRAHATRVRRWVLCSIGGTCVDVAQCIDTPALAV